MGEAKVAKAEAKLAQACDAAVPIVAIGASAGGITALQKLFETLPANLPYAFVVLQHLPAEQPSALLPLIEKWSRMRVRAAADGTRPAPHCIYIPAPDRILTLEAGTLRTRAAIGGGRRPGLDTIDAFLESLALRQGARSIAVILSGTGMDGTAGAVRIRQTGGIVIVQDPLTALHDGMPNAVIRRGIHDHVLPVSAIGRQLALCADPGYVRPPPETDWTGAMSATLERILALIRQQAGFDLSGYQPSPLLWRVQQRMDVRRARSFDDYASLVEDDPIELEALVRGIPLHVTGFFRDPEAWEVLRDDVLTPLVQEIGADQPVRVWTPACSSGEEAYSVAMMLDEVVHETGIAADFQVFATDAAPEILAHASRGVFRDQALLALPAARRKRFFHAAGGAFRVKRFLRDKMVFAPQDIVSDPPLSGLDLVTCRNLLIYLEPQTIRRVLFLLHGSLRSGGYLFLGKSEGYQATRRGFDPVSAPWNIYRKAGPMPREDGPFPAVARASDSSILSATAHRVALAHLDLPSVLIDDHCNLLRVYGNTEDILSLPAGEPTQNLIDLVPRHWVRRLQAALQQALAEREPLTLTNLPDRDTGSSSIDVRLTPLPTATDQAGHRILVSFIRKPDHAGAPDAGGERTAQARQYLAAAIDWQDEARISREELEASREELQALNEELKASNAQLDASNTQLNEANVQLHDKIAQLGMQSRVLSSGAVMTLFLDQDLKLRWFTPAMGDLLRLSARDTGRSIADLQPQCQDPDFLRDIREVLEANEPRGAVIRSHDDKWFVRRIYPYRSGAGAIAGVAITFADITVQTHAEVALRASELSLRRGQVWLSAQKEAFQAAMNGASLELSLGVLIRTLLKQAQDDRRCAFYIADGKHLRHVVGMNEAYARCVDGLVISPESLACGLAVATGKPVITRDVLDEPRWRSWTWLALEFGYRGCWSFPVETAEGSLVGSLAMYFNAPREPTPIDLELAAAFTQTAAVIISRHTLASCNAYR